MVGAFLTLHPELCMVVEDDTGIVGYACAALDSKKFRLKQEIAWIPEMCLKYPQKDTNTDLPKHVQVIAVCHRVITEIQCIVVVHRNVLHIFTITKKKNTSPVFSIRQLCVVAFYLPSKISP